MKSLALTVTLLLAVSVVECSRILVAAPLGTKSHQNVFGPLMKELAGRGHHLTLITNYRSKALEQISNIDQIEIEAMQIKPSLWAPLFNHSAMIDKNDFNYIFFKVFENIYTIHASREWAENMTVFTYEHPQVIQLLETSTFDMVLVSQVYATSMYPLAWHFNASLAIFNVNNIYPGFSRLLGETDHPEYIPYSTLKFSDQMNLLERALNTFMVYLSDWIAWRAQFIPAVVSTIQRVFPECPPIEQLEKDLSLVLVNTNPVFHYPRTMTPETVEIGGIHCRAAQPLSSELEAFVGNHEAGFIIFGVGSAIPMNQLPPDTLDAIIEAFARLPQRVIWQWKGEMRTNLPDNIMTVEWLPQQDLLGHENCRLFLTHGGLNSMMEAVYHGVPVLGLPLSNDQYANLARAQRKGYAISFKWRDITEESLFAAIQEMINNPRYSETIRKQSELMRDQPETPLERAVYWTEFVMRHKGARHLRLGSRYLAPYQRALIDVYCVIAVVILLPIALLVLVVRKCCCSKRNKVNDDKKKR